MYIYISMHIYIYIYMYIRCVYIYIYIHMSLSLSIYISLSLYIYIYIYIWMFSGIFQRGLRRLAHSLAARTFKKRSCSKVEILKVDVAGVDMSLMPSTHPQIANRTKPSKIYVRLAWRCFDCVLLETRLLQTRSRPAEFE